MALWVCGDCSAAYAVGIPACPQCGGTDYTEDGVPKITTAAGITYEPGHEPPGYEPESHAEPAADEAPAATPAKAPKAADPPPAPAGKDG